MSIVKRSFALLTVFVLIVSLFSFAAAADEGENDTANGELFINESSDISNPDEQVKELFTNDDEIYVKSTYDKLGWILWILVGAVVTAGIIVVSKIVNGKH